MSASRTGPKNYFYGKHRSEEEKRKLGDANLGKRLSEETKRKIGLASSKRHPSIETKRKMSVAKTGKYVGEKSSLWRGGSSHEPYPTSWTETLKKSIRERDCYVCQLCGGRGFPVHHVDYNKQNNDPKNLVTLCFPCHSRTNANREAWVAFWGDVGFGIIEERI